MGAEMGAHGQVFGRLCEPNLRFKSFFSKGGVVLRLSDSGVMSILMLLPNNLLWEGMGRTTKDRLRRGWLGGLSRGK